jgi:CRP-like cAMP-binding protein
MKAEENRERGLRKRILEEMTVNYSNALEKNFELAKQFIRITREGKVEVLFKDRLTGKEQILLYLIGKLYAKEAGLSTSESVDNKELMNELGIRIGSLLPWLKELRKNPGIKQIKKEKRRVEHYIPVNLIERVLQRIDKKLRGGK